MFPAITPAEASRFARLALNCIQREFPNKPDHVIDNPDDVQSTRRLHPAFYGCFDWHSAVHGHWMLVRLLRTFPDLPEVEKIRAALNRNLTADNLKAEADYFDKPNRESFERTYGWAWLLKLAEELLGHVDSEGKNWSTNLDPLAKAIVHKYKTYLPKQPYPIRSGVHPNTAFGLAFALDYARAASNKGFEDLVIERSLIYFGADRNYPAAWEPNGEDFFSPALMEADLMRRILDAGEFARWLHAFLPELPDRKPESLLQPALVTDRSDPRIVHLDGLNLSRAWCMRAIATALPASDPARGVLADAAELHTRSALDHVASGDYAGEHWLASFAVYLLSENAS